jgi:hypothetical protein
MSPPRPLHLLSLLLFQIFADQHMFMSSGDATYLYCSSGGTEVTIARTPLPN